MTDETKPIEVPRHYLVDLLNEILTLRVIEVPHVESHSYKEVRKLLGAEEFEWRLRESDNAVEICAGFKEGELLLIVKDCSASAFSALTAPEWDRLAIASLESSAHLRGMFVQGPGMGIPAAPVSAEQRLAFHRCQALSHLSALEKADAEAT